MSKQNGNQRAAGCRLVGAVKRKVAYEKESYRLSGQHLRRLADEHPEAFGKRKKGGR